MDPKFFETAKEIQDNTSVARSLHVAFSHGPFVGPPAVSGTGAGPPSPVFLEQCWRMVEITASNLGRILQRIKLSQHDSLEVLVRIARI